MTRQGKGDRHPDFAPWFEGGWDAMPGWGVGGEGVGLRIIAEGIPHWKL